MRRRIGFHGLVFLPRFLKSGVATVPQYLEIRFDSQTQIITNVIFLIAYVFILLPIILYTGAKGMIGILDVPAMLGELPNSVGVDRSTLALWLIIWAVGIIGSIYALFGGLRTVAVSDTINGVGLFVGGFMITGFALSQMGGDGGILAGGQLLLEQQSERFNSIGSNDSSVPFGTIFSGIFLINLFYWTTNQQIIQRTFGASSLAEGQKGVLLTGALKLLGPIFLVIPGMIAYSIFSGDDIQSDDAYGLLVNRVLPPKLTGFFAAAMIGAILSSFNSALNSSCTLFSLGVYKGLLRPDASEASVVRSGKIFGWIIALAAMFIAPLLSNTPNIFSYLQKMNGIYFIPIFAVVLVGMLTKRVPPIAAKLALVVGFIVIAVGYFVWPFYTVVESMHEFHFLGLVFGWLVILMLVIGELAPRETDFEQVDVGAVDMTPWRSSRWVGCLLIVLVISIYVSFANFNVLLPTTTEPTLTAGALQETTLIEGAAPESTLIEGALTDPTTMDSPPTNPTASDSFTTEPTE